MSSIFISHSSANNDIAAEVAERLRAQNHTSIFLDLDPEAGIVAGQSWERTLYRKLRACQAVIALCTDDYLASKWCFAEIALARMEGKLVFPLKVHPLADGSTMPGILMDRQFIDLRTNPEEGYHRLWRGLKEEDVLGSRGDWDSNESPYLGLDAFQEEHAAVFFGREDETRLGLELLERGSPGFVMVLGASGAGKSSLVRAGMLPRLRAEPGKWLLVDPFRPGRDPFSELALSLESTYRRYGSSTPDWEEIRASLSVQPVGREPSSKNPSPPPTHEVPADERLHQLIVQLEDLRNAPPEGTGDQLQHFLDLSLEQVRRIFSGRTRTPGQGSRPPAPATSLVHLAEELRLDGGHRDARVLIVIDQFEELLGRDEGDPYSSEFLHLIRASIEAEGSPITVLATMRSDFLGLFQRSALLRGIDFESLSLGSMRIEGMRRVIEEPARLGQVELEEGLADRLLEDAATPDALPLLSFTLWKLWDKYGRDGRLEIAEYEHLGGLEGTISAEAEAVLSAAQREGLEDDLREAFLQLARISEDGQYARRTARWDDVRLQPVHGLLDQLQRRRLLVYRGEGEARLIEVAHETLFRSWRPLTKWLDDHRQELLLRAGITRDTTTWNEAKEGKGGRPEDALWRGGRLEQAAELIDRMRLPEAETEFIRAGVREKRRKRNIRLGITAAVFVALSALTSVAWLQKGRADAQRAAALDLARVAVATERLLEDPNLSALILLELGDPEGTAFAAERMRDAMRAGLSMVLPGAEAPIRAAAFSPSGGRVATANDFGRARVMNADGTGLPVIFDLHEDAITALSFSPDGRRLVTGDASGTAYLWDTETGEPADSLVGPGGEITDVSFDGSGAQIAIAGLGVNVWDANRRDSPIAFNEHGEGWRGEPYVWSVAFSHSGDRIISAAEDSTARVWSADGSGDAVVLRGHTDRLTTASFGPDDRQVVTASYDGTARIWPADGSGPSLVLQGHADTVWAAAISPDGSLAVSGGSDGTARLWDALDGAEVAVLSGHEAAVVSAQFSSDGSMVLTASADGTARVWDPETGEELATFRGHEGPVTIAAFDPAGGHVLTASQGGTARIWPSHGVIDPLVISRFSGGVEAAAFSDDGATLGVILRGNLRMLGTLHIGEAGEPSVSALSAQQRAVANLRIAPDGDGFVTEERPGLGSQAQLWALEPEVGLIDIPGERPALVVVGPSSLVLTASSSGNLWLWPIQDGIVAGQGDSLGVHPNLSDATFSPDGSWLVTTSREGDVRLWHLENPDPADRPPPPMILGSVGDPGVSGTAFSPTADRFLTISADSAGIGEVQVWSLADGDSVATLRGHGGLVNGGRFSTDGARIVTASSDGTARIWNADGTGDPIVLRDGGGPVLAAAFGPSGNTVYTISLDGRVREWSTITHERLREALRSSTNQCLDPAFAEQTLGHDMQRAASAYAECERSFGRRPEGR